LGTSLKSSSKGSKVSKSGHVKEQSAPQTWKWRGSDMAAGMLCAIFHDPRKEDEKFITRK